MSIIPSPYFKRFVNDKDKARCQFVCLKLSVVVCVQVIVNVYLTTPTTSHCVTFTVFGVLVVYWCVHVAAHLKIVSS